MRGLRRGGRPPGAAGSDVTSAQAIYGNGEGARSASSAPPHPAKADDGDHWALGTARRYRDRTGKSITRDVLRSELGVSNAKASRLLKEIRLINADSPQKSPEHVAGASA
jgi:hypothetical protein